jgi:Ca2+/H+ antiporter
MQERHSEVFEVLRIPLTALGLALVSAGALLLCYVGFLVFQVINHPEDVRIVEFLLEQVRLEDKAIFGIAADQPFEINWSQSLRTVMFIFVGVMVLSVLASILKTLIVAGVQILRLATGQPERASHRTPTTANRTSTIDRGD